MINTKALWVIVRRTNITITAPHTSTPVDVEVNTPWHWVNDHVVGALLVDSLNARETDPDYSFVLMPNADAPAMGH